MVLAIPFADVAAALVVALLAFALTYLLVKPLALLLQQLPVVGSQVAGVLNGAASNVQKWAVSWLDSAAKPLIDLWNGIAANAYGFLQQTVNAVSYVVGETVTVALQASHLSTLIDAVRQEAQAYTESQQQAVEHYARQLALNEAADRAAAVAHAESMAQSYADNLAWQVTQAYESDIAKAEAQAQAGAAAAEKAAEVAAAAAVRPFETGLTDLQSQLGNLSGVLAGMGVGTLALAIPQILTDVETLTKDVRDCCGPSGTPKPPSVSGVLDAAALVAMFGLVAEGIANPTGTAQAIDGIVTPIASDARDILSAAGIHV